MALAASITVTGYHASNSHCPSCLEKLLEDERPETLCTSALIAVNLS